MFQRPHLLVFIACLFLVVYGSLLPFDLQPLPLAAAWERFANIPWLRLGAMSRADWIANILLYIPLSFLLILAMSGARARPALASIANTLMICMIVAISIEFLQVYFPPRTVSLNDLFAEFLGSIFGIAIWLFFGDRLLCWSRRVSHNDRLGLGSMLSAYLLFYLVFSLFPFDFVVSIEEFRFKLRSDTTGIFLAGLGCDSLLICGFKHIFEAVLTVPVGVLIAMRARGSKRSVLYPLVVGLLLGICVESLQVLTVSGVSQGVSAITKALGVVAGYLIFPHGKTISRLIDRVKPRPLIIALSIPYVLGLLIANKWFHSIWVSFPEAMKYLSEVRFLPFYYHYFTTETVALASVLFNAFLYSPIGFAAALWQKDSRDRRFLATVSVTAFLAIAIESARLFQAGTHADPSNVIIAVASAVMAQLLGTRLLELAVGLGASEVKVKVKEKEKVDMAGAVNPVRAPQKRAGSAVQLPKKQSWQSIFGWFLIAVSALSLYSMPVAAPLLLLGAGLFLVAQYLFPLAWLYILPAIVFVLDLTPWSGRFFWDELDATLLLIFGSLLLTDAPLGQLRNKVSKVIVVLLSASWAIAAVSPIIPLPEVDMNSFNNYLSSFNSLRVGKGFFWALIFMPFLSIVANNVHARIAMLRGVVIGAVLFSAWVVVERQLFSGILDLSNDFRVTASLSTMHTGGGHIEALIVLIFPLVVYWMIAEKGRWALLLGFAIVAGLGYSLLVTYARAGYGAFLGSVILMVMLFTFRNRGPRLGQKLAVPLLTMIAGGSLFVFLLIQSSYVQQRMGTMGKDMTTRLNHWVATVDMMDHGPMTSLFGMGLGRYPLTYAYRNPAGITLSLYRFSGAEDNPYLDLGAGDSLYFEQIITVRPNTVYTLSIDVKSNVDKGLITTPICEKAMLYSYDCKWISLRYESIGDAWQRLETTFDSGNLGAGNILNARPIKFSLFNPTPGSIVSVDNISLIGVDGHNLIKNGTFTETSDRWFFATDNHLAWHTKQLGVQLYFSQGLFGLVMFLISTLFALWRLLKNVVWGDVFSVALTSSIMAFILIGLFSSPFDAPRLTFLFFSLLFIANYEMGQRAVGPHRVSD